MFDIGNVAQPETDFDDMAMILDDLRKLRLTDKVHVEVVVDGWGRPKSFTCTASDADRMIRDYAGRVHTIEVVYTCHLGTGVFPGKRYPDFHPSRDAA